MGASDSSGRHTAKFTEEPRHGLQEQRMLPPDEFAAGWPLLRVVVSAGTYSGLGEFVSNSDAL